MELGEAAIRHGQVADFRPQILFKIKQNHVKTLVNSDLYTVPLVSLCSTCQREKV